MVELIINNNKIELPKKTQIKYTKQISDIFDLSVVACSHTNSFEFDKTPRNSQIMQQAGISGDSSNIPYIENTAVLKSDGFDLISKGRFKLQSTSDKYKGSVIDGMIDFFKAIENKTLGIDLDLSNFEHEKDLESVIESFTNQYYQYIIADYGGKNLYEDGINIDYLAPCFSVQRLWELIFSTFGFNCDYTNLGYLEGLYITYPKDIFEAQSNVLVATLLKNPYSTTNRQNIGGRTYPTSQYFWSSNVITEGSLINNWKYVIPETASYNFDLAIEMYCLYRRVRFYSRAVNVWIDILKNGSVIGSIQSDFQESDNTGEMRTTNFNLQCDAGDIIELSIWCPQYLSFRSRSFYALDFRHKSTNFKISKTDLGTTLLQNELKDFQIKDFFKEIVWRTGLTPIYNFEENTVFFETLDNRIDFINAQDFSHCFIDRTDETYENGYYQKNVFKQKNNLDTDFTGDGFLYVPNVNLPDQKIIAQSKIYAPDKKIVTSFGSFSTNQYKIWETETKDNDGAIEINYKGLSGRFYFIRKQQVSGTFKIISETLVAEDNVSTLPIAINTNTLFEEAVFNNYSEYQKIFNNFRVHNIDLAMSINDFIGADLTKPFYFKKENAYYICNKLTYQEGEKSNGEFIKINKL